MKRIFLFWLAVFVIWRMYIDATTPQLHADFPDPPEPVIVKEPEPVIVKEPEQPKPQPAIVKPQQQQQYYYPQRRRIFFRRR